jgi:hypothetical protein
MPTRHWLLTFLLAGCAWAIGYYMGGDSVPSGFPAGHAVGSGSALAESSGARRRAAGTSEEDASSEPIPQALLLNRLRSVLENPGTRWRKEQLARMLRSVPAAEIPEIMEQLKDLPRADREEVGELLLTQWAAERPREAMEYAYRMKTGVSAVLAEWTAADPVSATAWVKSLSRGPDRDAAISYFIPNLARRDPQAAFQMMKEKEERWQYHTEAVMTHWARKDLEAAVAAAESLTSGQVATLAASTVAGVWAKTDPVKALEWSLRFENPDLRRRAVSSALAEWAKSDPEAALKRVADFPGDLDRNAALATLVSAMAEKETDRAAAIAEQLPIGRDRQMAMHSLAYALAVKDPHRAAIFAEQVDPDWNSEAIHAVLSNLSPKDPKAALELALKLDRNIANQRPVLGTVLDDWMRREPSAALDWLAKNEVPKISNSEVVSAVSRWAKEHTEDARALVQASNVPAVMNGALQGIIEKDPIAAAKLALAKPDNDVYPGVWLQIGSAWANRDAAAAAEWLTQLPANRAQKMATPGVVNSWASKDAAATATWIDKLQAGDFRDRATYIFAYQISRQDPAGALTWVGSIQKEDSRNNLMVEVLRTWSERDLGAAKEWLSARPDLPAYVRANLPELQPKR